MDAPRSILVVKPSSLGDVVHTLPAVSFLKQAWPRAHLRWMIAPPWAPLLEGNPDVDEVVIFPRKQLGGSPLRAVRWLLAVRRSAHSELVLDFQGLLRSAVTARFCGGRVIGLSDAREGARFFYDQRVPVGREHAVSRYLKLVAALGIDTSGPLRWPLPEGKRPEGWTLEEPFVVLHPFARGKGKSLSVEDVGKWSGLLPMPVVLAGKAEERVPGMPNLHDWLNRTSLAELIWVLRRARFVVSVDSGPMHIAAALGRPLLALYAWSDPERVGPWEREAWVWKDRVLWQPMGPVEGKPLAAPDTEAIAGWVAERLKKNDSR